uniref:Immunoglobulin V-set domain-containing protein n=1 Tax=Magallana gigas TaxID=29159 RepID=K1RF85_MAGGI
MKRGGITNGKIWPEIRTDFYSISFVTSNKALFSGDKNAGLFSEIETLHSLFTYTMDYRTLRKLAIVFGLVIHAQAEAEVKEGSPAVAADPRVSVDTNENLGELSIRNILEHDAGDYFCTVEFSDRLPQTTRYTVYIVDSTSKPPSPTTSTRVAQSSTVSTDSGTQSTNAVTMHVLVLVRVSVKMGNHNYRELARFAPALRAGELRSLLKSGQNTLELVQKS